MNLDAELEMLLVERKVGILDDLNIRHLLARGYNAREKPIERLFKIISEWERNTFREYCGRDAKNKPDSWRELYRQYQRRANQGNAPPLFISFKQYQERLEEFIRRYNITPHNRTTLGSGPLIPIEEYKRLYTTRYVIPEKTLALIIMKPTSRKIGKLGVQCFRKNWFYYHEAMAEYKGRHVEVRYSEDDYSKVFVVLPDSIICEAKLITPTSIIKPNQQTLKVVNKIEAHERGIIRDYQLIRQSNTRGETAEDRAAGLLKPLTEEVEGTRSGEEETSQSHVYLWTHLERKKLYATASVREVTKNDVAAVEADTSIFDATPVKKFDEFD